MLYHLKRSAVFPIQWIASRRFADAQFRTHPSMFPTARSGSCMKSGSFTPREVMFKNDYTEDFSFTEYQFETRWPGVHSLAHSHTRTHMHAQLHKHALRARSYARSWMHAHTHTHTHRHFLTQARSAHAHSHTRSLASISPPTQNPRVRNASMMAFSCGRPVAHASERHSRQRRMWWWWSPSSSSSWSSCTRSTR